MRRRCGKEAGKMESEATPRNSRTQTETADVNPTSPPAFFVKQSQQRTDNFPSVVFLTKYSLKVVLNSLPVTKVNN